MAVIALYALVNWLGIDADLYGLGIPNQLVSVGAFGVVATMRCSSAPR
jgi:hypothetical protein